MTAIKFIRLSLVSLIFAQLGLFCLSANVLGYKNLSSKQSATDLRSNNQQNSIGKYRVSVKESSPLLADVEAEISVKDGHLFMASWGADHLPNGWASFVKNLRVTDNAGKDVAFESKPNGAWQLSDVTNSSVRLSYQVDLSFTKNKWKYGNEQAGIYQSGALFVVSKAVFIISDNLGACQITFDVPKSWKISTPWKPSPSGQRTFIAQDGGDLIDNSLVLGDYTEYQFKERNFSFILALPGDISQSKELIAEALGKTLKVYSRVFDKTPESHYLMTIFRADIEDSEAFAGSSAFSENIAITRQSAILWADTLAHEFFHRWNGHDIKPQTYAETQWFSEGFTEYFANLALVQQKLLTEEDYVKRMEKNLGLYAYYNWSSADSLKQAGSNKGRNRLGVYHGGWAIAFFLDVTIREETRNKRNLEDFMRLLYERFGLTGKPYSYDDLVKAAGEIVGRDMSAFFRKYVEGSELAPVEDYLRRAGFDGYLVPDDGEIYIKKSFAATAKQSAIQRGLFSAE